MEAARKVLEQLLPAVPGEQRAALRAAMEALTAQRPGPQTRSQRTAAEKAEYHKRQLALGAKLHRKRDTLAKWKAYRGKLVQDMDAYAQEVEKTMARYMAEIQAAQAREAQLLQEIRVLRETVGTDDEEQVQGGARGQARQEEESEADDEEDEEEDRIETASSAAGDVEMDGRGRRQKRLELERPTQQYIDNGAGVGLEPTQGDGWQEGHKRHRRRRGAGAANERTIDLTTQQGTAEQEFAPQALQNERPRAGVGIRMGLGHYISDEDGAERSRPRRSRSRAREGEAPRQPAQPTMDMEERRRALLEHCAQARAMAEDEAARAAPQPGEAPPSS